MLPWRGRHAGGAAAAAAAAPPRSRPYYPRGHLRSEAARAAKACGLYKCEALGGILIFTDTKDYIRGAGPQPAAPFRCSRKMPHSTSRRSAQLFWCLRA